MQSLSLLREPEAGNPHIRFDEREQEPESCQTGLRRRSESYANCHRETTATALRLFSTLQKWRLIPTHYKKGAPLEYVISALLKLLQKGAPFYDQR
jgi:hypothetical protein